jgi:hypothetical protein
MGGCGSGTPSPSVSSPPSAATPSAVDLPSPSASSATASVPWSDDLLAVLPADVGGLPLTPEPDAFAASPRTLVSPRR